jgi:DNA gyrase subunit A
MKPMHDPWGRVTTGVRGISLANDDKVVGLSIIEEGATLLVASEKGIGKRTTFEEYRQQTRGGKGDHHHAHDR